MTPSSAPLGDAEVAIRTAGSSSDRSPAEACRFLPLPPSMRHSAIWRSPLLAESAYPPPGLKANAATGSCIPDRHRAFRDPVESTPFCRPLRVLAVGREEQVSAAGSSNHKCPTGVSGPCHASQWAYVED